MQPADLSLIRTAGTACAALLLATSVLAADSTIKNGSDALPDQAQVDEVNMDLAIKEVQDTVHMPAPMEIELIDGVDPIAEAAELGWIIETTLQEVVAAIDAAAATPDREDDIAAMRLKHRGSYRFYYEGKSESNASSTTVR